MADFYAVHCREIERAFYTTERVGDSFRIALREPFGVVDLNDMPICDKLVTIVTFLRLASGKYVPASIDDHQAIAGWSARHAETPDDVWHLPWATNVGAK